MWRSVVELVGTITVDEFADPEFWRPDDNPASALNLHRMMSEELLRFAEDLAAKQTRCESLTCRAEPSRPRRPDYRER
jgi:hypothetical protein